MLLPDTAFKLVREDPDRDAFKIIKRPRKARDHQRDSKTSRIDM
jgi:hypothetical protein